MPTDIAMKEQIKRIPILGKLTVQIYRRIRGDRTKPKSFPGSEKYWENRYLKGGNSGVGSYQKFAEFKAEVINRFVVEHGVKTVIEFGCGDGNQLRHADYPRYLGFDVSETALSLCKQIFLSDKSKAFKLMCDYDGEKADLTLSLDVIYHLVEDGCFRNYMRTLFKASDRYVIIYSSDSDDNTGFEGTHIKHRKVTKWIQENVLGWILVKHIPNRYPYKGNHKIGSFADFFIYEKA
jgi:cyclopropane fatty-acyl-phospholipid synthase-like methyltransferase